jgi:hypothetical protein
MGNIVELTKEKIIEIWEDVADAFENTKEFTKYGFCYYLKHRYQYLFIASWLIDYDGLDKFFKQSLIHPKDVGFEEWYDWDPHKTLIQLHWPIFPEEGSVKESRLKRAKFARNKIEDLKELWGI